MGKHSVNEWVYQFGLDDRYLTLGADNHVNQMVRCCWWHYSSQNGFLNF